MKVGLIMFGWFAFLCLMGYSAYETTNAGSEFLFLVFFFVLWIMAALATPGNGDMEEWYAVPLWYFMLYGSVAGALTMIFRLGYRIFY